MTKHPIDIKAIQQCVSDHHLKVVRNQSAKVSIIYADEAVHKLFQSMDIEYDEIPEATREGAPYDISDMESVVSLASFQKAVGGGHSAEKLLEKAEELKAEPKLGAERNARVKRNNANTPSNSR